MMKKRVFLGLVLAAAVTGGVSAEGFNSYAPGIDSSKVLINAGVGWGFSAYSMGIPPISVSADFRLPIGIPLTLGVIGTFNTWGFSTGTGNASIDVTYTNIAIGGRAAWHFGFLRNLDTYIGLTLGYVIQSADAKYGSYWDNVPKTEYPAASFFLWGANIGLRYFFTSRIGAYLELGYSGLQVASAGLSLKF